MIHLLLDAARMKEDMREAKALNPNHGSLYKGRSEELLADFAPYLFRFSSENQFADWYWDNGWGKSWGLFAKSEVPAQEVYRHFRKFLLVHNDDGEQVYFRFYDPRVLRVFLQTCDARQLHEFFGPIRYFLIEDASPDTATFYSFTGSELTTETRSWTDIKQTLQIEA